MCWTWRVLKLQNALSLFLCFWWMQEEQERWQILPSVERLREGRRQKSFQRVSNLLLLLLQWEIQRNHEQGENLSESANFESPAASDLLLLPTWISWRLQKISCSEELKVVKAKAHFTKAKIFIFKIFSKTIQNGKFQNCVLAGLPFTQKSWVLWFAWDPVSTSFKNSICECPFSTLLLTIDKSKILLQKLRPGARLSLDW